MRCTHLDELTHEQDNFRAALSWASERGAGALALRLARRLAHYWVHLGLLHEGDASLRDALASGKNESPELRAPVLSMLSGLAYKRGAYEEAALYGEQTLELFEKIEDERGRAASSNNVGLAALAQGDLVRARVMFERALALNRSTGAEFSVVTSLLNLGYVALYEGDGARAAELSEHAAALGRRVDNRSGLAAGSLVVNRLDGRSDGLRLQLLDTSGDLLIDLLCGQLVDLRATPSGASF